MAELSQAREFWNRVRAANLSDDRIRSQARQEVGVVQIGGHFMFRDGSSIRDTVVEGGRMLVLQDQQ